MDSPIRRILEIALVYVGAMSESPSRSDWAVSGLAQLLDTVVTTVNRSTDLTESDREQFAETGAAGFSSGMSLSQLVGAFLGGAGEIWEHVFSEADESRMVELARALRRVSEQAVGSLAEGFESAQRMSIRAEESLRRSFFDELFSRDADLERLADTAGNLGLPPFDQATVAVARSTRAITDAGPIHRRVRAELEARAPQRNLWVTAKDGNLVVIALDTTPQQLGTLLSGALSAVGGTEWRVGVGSEVGELAGVATSHGDAMEALRIGASFDLPSPTNFERVLAQRLLSADTKVIETLLRRVVEPLMAKPNSGLLATLASYMKNGGNMAGVARDLNIGVRTVAYRLDRIGQITGYKPENPEDRFILELAYRAAPLIETRRRRQVD